MPRDAGDDAYEELARERREAKERNARVWAARTQASRMKVRASKSKSKRKPKRKRTRSKTAVGKMILARLHQERAQLEETRNNLRAIVEDAKELAYVAEEGMDQLMTAIDTLSKYV